MKKLQLKVNKDIELKTPQMEDAAHVFILVLKNKDFLGKYLEWIPDIKTPYDIVDFFERYERKSFFIKVYPLIIWYKGEIIGIISFNNGNSAKNEVEIGYWVGEEFTGKGIVTKCTQALIQFAFSMTDISTILICCEISNIKSYNIPQNLGFEFVKEEENVGFYRDGKPNKLTYRLKK